MHLRQTGFTYSACSPFTKNKRRIKKLKKQEIRDKFIKTNQIKFVFKMIWLTEILKIQLEEQFADKVLRDKIFNIAEDPKYDGCQRGLASMVYKSFDKKTSEKVLNMKIFLIKNQQNN